MCGFENTVDQIPERPGLALRKEVGTTGDGRVGTEPVGGEKVGIGRVVDIGGVDQVGVDDRSFEARLPWLWR